MNNRTKDRKFVADNALLFLHLQVYDFLIPKNTVQLFVWAKENSFFVGSPISFKLACVLITLELEHMQKGRLRNIEEHYQNRVSSRVFL